MFHPICYGPNTYVFKIFLIDINTFLIVTKIKLDGKKQHVLIHDEIMYDELKTMR